jgi:hypothetical protein
LEAVLFYFPGEEFDLAFDLFVLLDFAFEEPDRQKKIEPLKTKKKVELQKIKKKIEPLRALRARGTARVAALRFFPVRPQGQI